MQSKLQPLERNFQPRVIARLEDQFPGTIVLKNDPNYIQGFPDLTALLQSGLWVVLETKRASGAPLRPNQDYYVNYLKQFGLSAFVNPTNMEEVMNAIQQSFRPIL